MSTTSRVGRTPPAATTRGLCVGESQRYDEDFTPPDSPIGGWDALILDDLTGVTNGENEGFVPTP